MPPQPNLCALHGCPYEAPMGGLCAGHHGLMQQGMAEFDALPADERPLAWGFFDPYYQPKLPMPANAKEPRR